MRHDLSLVASLAAALLGSEVDYSHFGFNTGDILVLKKDENSKWSIEDLQAVASQCSARRQLT